MGKKGKKGKKAGLKAGLINNINNSDFGKIEILDFGNFGFLDLFGTIKKLGITIMYYFQ